MVPGASLLEDATIIRPQAEIGGRCVHKRRTDLAEAGCQHSQTRVDAPDADVHVVLSSNHSQRQRHARMSDMLEVPVVVVPAKIRLAPMLREQPEMDIRRSI